MDRERLLGGNSQFSRDQFADCLLGTAQSLGEIDLTTADQLHSLSHKLIPGCEHNPH
jgi:hypothetical protein